MAPLPKKENPTEYSHLRPISILFELSEILQCVIKKQLTQHVGDNAIVLETRSGFRSHFSRCRQYVDRVDAA